MEKHKLNVEKIWGEKSPSEPKVPEDLDNKVSRSARGCQAACHIID